MAETKKKHGKPFQFVPKKISDWAKQSSTNPWVNNYKIGGGMQPWNGRK